MGKTPNSRAAHGVRDPMASLGGEPPPFGFIPKPTDFLAEERTFLAWMRTSLAIMAMGFGFCNQAQDKLHGIIIAVVALLAAGLVAVSGTLEYYEHIANLQQDAFDPKTWLPALMSSSLALIVVILTTWMTYRKWEILFPSWHSEEDGDNSFVYEEGRNSNGDPLDEVPMGMAEVPDVIGRSAQTERYRLHKEGRATIAQLEQQAAYAIARAQEQEDAEEFLAVSAMIGSALVACSCLQALL